MNNSLYLTSVSRSGRLFCWVSLIGLCAWGAGAQTVYFNNGVNWTVNQSGLASANISGNVLDGTDGNGNEAVTAWYDSKVSINGFTAVFTYQDVGGSDGANADGASFDLQESGSSALGAGGGELAINGLSPSADWEINLYLPNGIGILYHTNGATFNYQPTGAVDVSSGDPINFTILCTAAGAVQETLLDTVTQNSYTTNFNIGSITTLLGGGTAYIGFSSSDGGVASVQTISNFGFQSVTNPSALAVVANLPASGVQATQATLNGQVHTNGSFSPAITIYYGTADGGTTAASWANSISLGVQIAPFSQTVTGLSPNTTYYYTVKGVNSVGTSWATPSESFTTPPVSAPQVTNAPATAIGSTLATLNGQVLSTGGAPTSVILYYGTTDGHSTAGAWAHNVPLGTQTGAFSQTVSLSPDTTYFFTSEASNGAGVAWAVPSLSFTTSISMTPLLLTGFNLDLVIESNAVGPAYTGYAMEFNPGEGTCFYQQGLPGTAYGLPASGSFSSVIDGTLFQFQPYTNNNALVMSSDTGIASGTLTLVNPATYDSIAILANSAAAEPTSTGSLTVNFADATTYTTSFDAADWFNNSNFALQGVDRIDIADGGTDGGPSNPRFYQTTLDLDSLLGASNKPIASLTFGQAEGVGATAVYAISGHLSASNTFTLAQVTNLPATAVQPTAATFNGQVLSTGGFRRQSLFTMAWLMAAQMPGVGPTALPSVSRPGRLPRRSPGCYPTRPITTPPKR